MKFRIYRTSSWGGTWSPIKPDWDLSQYNGFYVFIDNDGRSDLILNNEGIREKMYWWELYIEIRNLQELLELSKKFGEIIVNAKDNSLEIYDDYRE
jgi:hypothetical protein